MHGIETTKSNSCACASCCSRTEYGDDGSQSSSLNTAACPFDLRISRKLVRVPHSGLVESIPGPHNNIETGTRSTSASLALIRGTRRFNKFCASELKGTVGQMSFLHPCKESLCINYFSQLTVRVTCAGAGTAKPSSQKNDKA